MKKSITIQVTEEEYNVLLSHAKKDHRTVKNYCELIIRDKLKDISKQKTTKPQGHESIV